MPSIVLNVKSNSLIAGSLCEGECVLQVAPTEDVISVKKISICFLGTVESDLVKLAGVVTAEANQIPLYTTSEMASKGMFIVDNLGLKLIMQTVRSRQEIVCEALTITSLGMKMKPGCRKDSFSFALPVDSPASFTSEKMPGCVASVKSPAPERKVQFKSASISYVVKAHLEYEQGGAAKSLEQVVPITVMTTPLPTRALSLDSSVKKEAVNGHGEVACHLALATNMYLPGEVVSGQILVDNNSNKEVQAEVSLVQTVSVTSSSEDSEAVVWSDSAPVASYNVGELAPFTCRTVPLQLVVPKSTYASLSSKFVSVSYEVCAEVSSNKKVTAEIIQPIFLLDSSIARLPPPKALAPIPEPTHQSTDRPLTDVAVIFIDMNEKVPEGYTMIKRTADGTRSANLNAGTHGFLGIASADIFLCLSTSNKFLPVTDVGVFYPKKEKLPAGWTVVKKTVGGDEATLNSGNKGETIFLCIKRDRNVPPVTDIQVLNADEDAKLVTPAGYSRITKSVSGDVKADCNYGGGGKFVYLCVKKAPRPIEHTQLPPDYSDLAAAIKPNEPVSFGVTECVQCRNNIVTCMVQECGHNCLCELCAISARACPVCKAAMNEPAVKIYVSRERQ